MSRWVVRLEEIGDDEAPRYGSKAASLGPLARAGFPVPVGFGISGRAFAHHLEGLLGPDWWGRAATDAEGVRQLVLGSELPEETARLILAAYRELDPDRALPLAVRSSSTAEDGEVLSAAGVQDTLLGIAGPEALLDGVRTVWASLWNERARAYLDGAEPGAPVLMGVLVQELVDPDAAGVLFTANPVSGDRTEMLINAALGLGEPVLSGRVAPDTFVLDKGTLSIKTRSVADKRLRVSVIGGEVAETELSEDEGSRPSLTDEQVRRVASMGRAVEEHLGAPRDIEWALRRDRLFLLQARPITGRRLAGPAAPVEEPRAGAHDVWTNANVGEALPGVATPLTWSIASRYSERGFRRAFGALGCEVPEGSVLVGQFSGRIYLNLSQFAAIAGQAPLLGAKTLAELGGARWPEDAEPPPSSPAWRLTPGFLRRLPGALTRLVYENLTMEAAIERLEERLEERSRRLSRADLTSWTDHRLAAELSAIDELLEVTGDAMLTCAANSLASFLVLRRLMRRWVGADAAGLMHELLAGAADLESARPGVALWHIAESIRGDEEVGRLLLERDPGELDIDDLPSGSRLRRDLETFLAAYGYRAVREAELMTPRWSEDPSLIFATLREYLRSGGLPPGRDEEERREARRRAWGRVERRLGPVRRKVIRRLVELARRYHRLREGLRARVTLVLGLYRTVALEVGRRIGHPDAAFFLTIDEVHRLLREGQAIEGRASLGSVIAARRRTYELNRSLPDPPATFVGRPPARPEPPTLRSSRCLQGLGASPGTVSGEARVLAHPDEASELRAGEILVVTCADVGWSPMFLLAGALVTDLGGVLSHAAVVAREYGVPAVFGVTDATRLIRSGQRVTVDGDAGVVTIDGE